MDPQSFPCRPALRRPRPQPPRRGRTTSRKRKEYAMYTKSLLKGAVLGIGLAFAGAAYAGDYSCPPSAEKGNNGWGQEKHGGSDGTNNGSDNGNAEQASTKTASTER